MSALEYRRKRASKPTNFDAMWQAAADQDREAWQRQWDLYRLQVEADGEDW